MFGLRSALHHTVIGHHHLRTISLSDLQLTRLQLDGDGAFTRVSFRAAKRAPGIGLLADGDGGADKVHICPWQPRLPAWEMRIDIVEMDAPHVQVLQRAGDPLDKVSDDLCERSSAQHGEVGWDAYFFLHEPLYHLRSDYAVANWVVWPLCSTPGDPDLMEASYRLSEGGWSPG